jgi:hypothetical protein
MRKGLYLVLSLLVVFSLGAVFLHCGDDNGEPTECEEGQECCEVDPTCPIAGWTCNTTTNTCEDPCETDKCCEEDPTCDTGTRCDFATGDCGDCCADAPAGEYHIWVSGMVMDMTTQQGFAAAVAAISPMEALTVADPTKLSDQVASAGGLFQTVCFDVTEVALGIVIMSDDDGWDGIGGTYFPTGTPVKGWDKNSEKYCAEETKVFAVPNTLVAGLDAATSVDSAGFGFVMGFVVDATFSMVEGAVIKNADGTDLVEVIYPNATMTAFDGTATSANGIFILPHTNFAAGITDITAEKTGVTFGEATVAPKAGFCTFTYIAAE